MSDLQNVILTTLDSIVARLLGSQPTTTGGKPLDQVVYSQLQQGVLIDPETFKNPWTPTGSAVDPTSPGAAAAITRSQYAAWRTAELTNDMLLVTTDGSYRPYRSGRHLDTQYKEIITEMQPAPAPATDPAVQKRVNDAMKLLHVLDADGNPVGDTPLFQRYQDNAQAYADARAAFAQAQADAQADPAKLAIWPQLSLPLKAKVDRAFNAWKTGGAVQVEQALNTIESEGQPITDAMVANAREQLDKWSLPLSGLELTTPYTFIDPTAWCDPTRDDIGWAHLSVTSKQADTHVSSAQDSFAKSFSQSHSSSTSGGGQVGYAFLFVGADVSGSDSEGGWGSTSSKDSSFQFHNDGSDFSLELEWAVARTRRPWLNTDLFSLRNWYLPGQKAHCISDGTIAGQAGQEDPLMPMIPMDFLLIRNVKIHSSNWGSDEHTLSTMFASTKGDYRASSSSYGGSAGVSLGFITFGGRVSHSESDATADLESQFRSTDTADFGWTFEDGTLEIRGTQLVGWVSTVVPPCPPMDDPQLGQG